MGKNKNKCSKCKKRHYPATGKNCTMQSSDGDSDDSILLPVKQKKVKTDSKMGKNASASGSLPGCPLDAPKKDLVYDKRVKTPGQGDQSIEQEVQFSSEEEQGKETVQMKILAELRRVHDRLDDVEMKVADCSKEKDIGDRRGTKSK